MSHSDLFGWGTPVEIERRIRVRLTLAAYAYEIADTPLMTDAAFDALAAQSDRTVVTGHLDDWWQREFQPHTGQWIHTHPELTRVGQAYRRLTA